MECKETKTDLEFKFQVSALCEFVLYSNTPEEFGRLHNVRFISSFHAKLPLGLRRELLSHWNERDVWDISEITCRSIFGANI